MLAHAQSSLLQVCAWAVTTRVEPAESAEVRVMTSRPVCCEQLELLIGSERQEEEVTRRVPSCAQLQETNV